MDRSILAAFVAAACLVGAAVGVAYYVGVGGSSHDRACVTVTDADSGREAVVSARVADTPQERYRGLSGTQPLENGAGMLFVFDDQGVRTFVMRDMNYPLDMVFVGANHTVSVVHHAPVESDGNLTNYRGRAQWVLEVRYGWATRHGVDHGDRLSVRYGTC